MLFRVATFALALLAQTNPSLAGPASPPTEAEIAAGVALTVLNDIVDPTIQQIRESRRSLRNHLQNPLSIQIFKDLLGAYYHQMQELTSPSQSPSHILVRPVPYILWAEATQNRSLTSVGQAAFQAAGSNPTQKIERLKNSTMFLQGLILMVDHIEQQPKLTQFPKSQVRSLLLGIRETAKQILILDLDPLSGLQLKGAAEYLPMQRLYNVLLVQANVKPFAGLAEIIPGRLTVRLLTALDSNIHRVLRLLGTNECTPLLSEAGKP